MHDHLISEDTRQVHAELASGAHQSEQVAVAAAAHRRLQPVRRLARHRLPQQLGSRLLRAGVVLHGGDPGEGVLGRRVHGLGAAQQEQPVHSAQMFNNVLTKCCTINGELPDLCADTKHTVQTHQEVDATRL